jgi:biotin carboxyl carrier protein
MAYSPEDKRSEWWIDGDVHVVRSVRPIDLLLDELGMTATAIKGPEVLLAPMPGLVLRVDATAGSAIEQGQTLIVLEAMKMENNLKSPSSGTIAEVYVQAGQAVEKGAKLLRFA